MNQLRVTSYVATYLGRLSIDVIGIGNYMTGQVAKVDWTGMDSYIAKSPMYD